MSKKVNRHSKNCKNYPSIFALIETILFFDSDFKWFKWEVRQDQKIAIFFGNILREERISVFPHFSPKKSVFSSHEWLQFECRAKRDILNRSHEWPEYTDFAWGKVGENWISLFDYNMTKEGYFTLSNKPFEYYFELFSLVWRCLEKS